MKREHLIVFTKCLLDFMFFAGILVTLTLPWSVKWLGTVFVYAPFVEQYKEEGWGIYDDSSDLDRAVVLSDGYYGDPSSVVEIYRETEKPTMIQDTNIL